MNERYRDRPEHASDGKEFEQLVIRLHQELFGQILHPTGNDIKAQIEIGDTYEGHEIKHLQKSNKYLHIEIAEQTDLNSGWRPSGIFCDRQIYICGNESDV